MYLTVHDQTFFKNVCKDVKESHECSEGAETNVGIEVHGSIIASHGSKRDGPDKENDFQKQEARGL